MKYDYYFKIELIDFDKVPEGEKKFTKYLHIETNKKYFYPDYDYLLSVGIFEESCLYNKYSERTTDIEINSIKDIDYNSVTEDTLKCKYNYYIKKKLYYVSELLTEDVRDYNPYPTGFRNLRVYEIVDGEFKEFYNTEHLMEDYCLDILKEYLIEIKYDKELDESTFDENDYEFIEL